MIGFSMIRQARMAAVRHLFPALASLLIGTRLLAGADLSGRWSTSFVTEEGQTKESTLTLTIADGKVSGSFVSARGKAAIGGGTVEGDEITFYVVRKANYDETKINFSGTLKGDVLDLKMQFGDRAPVSMTAKRS